MVLSQKIFFYQKFKEFCNFCSDHSRLAICHIEFVFELQPSCEDEQKLDISVQLNWF